MDARVRERLSSTHTADDERSSGCRGGCDGVPKLPGGPGRLPSQGSHRSGRAELPHPARQNTALLRGEPVHNARSREREALQQRAHAMPVYVPGVGAA